MLILLPPSEGKTAPGGTDPVDLSSLSFPALGPTRRRVMTALVALCRGPVDTAASTLGLGPTQRGEIAANARLRRAPVAPAIDVYTGVLYEALGAATLSPAARRRLSSQVVVASAMWGLVRPFDRIPSYRLSAGTTLPGVGSLAATWRDPLASTLSEVEGLIVDLRSGGYVALGPVPDQARCVSVRVLQDTGGRRTVVSHHNKATKGRLVRSLLTSRRTPRSPGEFADALDALGYRVEPRQGKEGTVLDVVVRDL